MKGLQTRLRSVSPARFQKLVIGSAAVLAVGLLALTVARPWDNRGDNDFLRSLCFPEQHGIAATSPGATGTPALTADPMALAGAPGSQAGAGYIRDGAPSSRSSTGDSGPAGPYFSQRDPGWAGDPYGGQPSADNGCGTSVEQCGSALTSLATVLALLQGAGGMTPAELNKAFSSGAIATDNGWVSTGYAYGALVWPAVNAVSARTSLARDGLPRIRFAGFGSGRDAELRSDLHERRLAVLELPGHFVAAAGLDGDRILLHDPYFGDEARLQDMYLSHVRSSLRFEASDDLSALAVTVPAGLRVRLTDSEGRITGTFSGATPDEAERLAQADIPGSAYHYEPGVRNPDCSRRSPQSGSGANMVVLLSPANGAYQLEVIAPRGGPTSAAIHSITPGGDLQVQTYRSPGAMNQALQYAAADQGTIRITQRLLGGTAGAGGGVFRLTVTGPAGFSAEVGCNVPEGSSSCSTPPLSAPAGGPYTITAGQGPPGWKPVNCGGPLTLSRRQMAGVECSSQPAPSETRALGGLEVRAVLEGGVAPPGGLDFSFTVAGPDFSAEASCTVAGGDDSCTPQNGLALPPGGPYQVSEQAPDGWIVLTCSGGDTIAPGENLTVVCSNQRIPVEPAARPTPPGRENGGQAPPRPAAPPPEGQVQVQVIVAGGGVSNPLAFNFTIAGPGGPAQSASCAIPSGGASCATAPIPVPAGGAYSARAQAAAAGGWRADCPSTTVPVRANTTAVITCTVLGSGEIVLQQQLLGGPAPRNGLTFGFHISGPGGFSAVRSCMIPEGAVACTAGNLGAPSGGPYAVTQTTSPPGWPLVACTPAALTVPPANAAHVTCTNRGPAPAPGR